MSNSENLLKATLNRIKARLEEKLIKKANEASVFAKEAPDRLKKELEILKTEIFEEAERIQKEEDANAKQGVKANTTNNASDIKTKKQISEWFMEHKRKSNCNQWYTHTKYGCNEKKIYMSIISMWRRL